MNKRGTSLLAAGIVRQAVKDWQEGNEDMKAECERFFESEWYSILRELAPGVIPADIAWRLKK